jgi:hypothetical protein
LDFQYSRRFRRCRADLGLAAAWRLPTSSGRLGGRLILGGSAPGTCIRDADRGLQVDQLPPSAL